METWPEAHRYKGFKCAPDKGVNLGGTAEGMPFVPTIGTEVFFIVSGVKTDGEKTVDAA